MITLHNVIEKSKLLLITAIITTILFIVLFMLLRIGLNLKERFFPTPPPPPTVLFGKLPKIIFPKNVRNEKFSFSIDTISGTLPTLPDRISIYPVISYEQNLLALERARKRISSLGFTTKEQLISESLYRWETPNESETLFYDILSLNFTYLVDSQTKEKLYAQSNVKDKSNAIVKVQSLISTLSNFPKDIDPNKTSVQNLNFTNGVLKQSTSIANTKILRVDFFQGDVENFPIFYPNPLTSTIYAIVAGENSNPIITESSFYHLDIQTNSATYPIKTAQEAFLELKNNNAYVASYYGVNKLITIKNVTLGYYAGKKQQFLMPIIIFEGKDGFYAYVSAIKNEWTK